VKPHRLAHIICLFIHVLISIQQLPAAENIKFRTDGQPFNCSNLPEITSRTSADSAEQKHKFGHGILSGGKNLLDDTWYFISAPTRLNRHSAKWVGGVVLTSGLIYAYDADILNAFRRNNDLPVYSDFLKIGADIGPLGHMGITNKYYFGGLVVGAVFKIKFLEEICFQILESHLVAGIFKNLANVVVGRARPFEEKGPYFFKFNAGTSFPSGHASTSFQLATILAAHVKHRSASVVFYGLASAIAAQRIESRGHWPSDVFIGALYGTVVSRAILQRHEQRKLNLTVNPTGVGLAYSF